MENTNKYQAPLLTPEVRIDALNVPKASASKNVAVIGGGIAGMESAMVLAKRGHNVTLFEQSSKLGGKLLYTSALDFKDSLKELLAWYTAEIAKYPNIHVEFYSKITDVKLINADKIVVATGSKTAKPNIKGIDRAIPALDYLSGKSPIYGNNVIVIGGGVAGCEIAYDLILKGFNPTIIETKPALMANAKGEPNADSHSTFLRGYLTNNAEIYLNTNLFSVTFDGILAKDEEGRFKLKADHVIYALGLESDPIARSKVKLVGDAKTPGTICAAIESARKICMKI